MTITLLLMIVAAGLFIIQWRQPTSSFDDLNQEMQFVVSDFVAKDKAGNDTGDGSLFDI